MKLFTDNMEAFKYAQTGAQALHVWTGNKYFRTKATTPVCFKKSEFWGHLLDQDRDRLQATAIALGVKRVVIGGEGRPSQHVDLCSGPLKRAITICEQCEAEEN